MEKTEILFTAAGILSAVMFVLFLLSGLTANFHLGCGVGMAVSMISCLAFFRHKQFYSLICSLWQTRTGKTVILASGAIISVCIITAVILSALMITAAYAPPKKPVNIIVLGCRVKEKGPSLMLEKRIGAAYKYMSENENVICIASGGKGDDEPVSEAECIKTRLVEMGISPDRIICEDRSANTFQNIRNSYEIMEKLGMEKEAVIITSEFHQLRAKILCKKQGIASFSISSRTFPPLLPSYWVREWFGLIHEIFIGRK